MALSETSSDLVVDARGLVKSFGKTQALAGLDLEVARGEVHGFLGPNGAGKSTTLRVLLGMLRIDAGTVRLLGGDPWRDITMLHSRLAYVPGDVSLWPNLSGGEVIDLLGRLQGGQDTARRDRYLEMFDLDPTKKSRTYSRRHPHDPPCRAVDELHDEWWSDDEEQNGAGDCAAYVSHHSADPGAENRTGRTSEPRGGDDSDDAFDRDK
jgi:hypothetical protein